jgi:hypothetical protein
MHFKKLALIFLSISSTLACSNSDEKMSETLASPEVAGSSKNINPSEDSIANLVRLTLLDYYKLDLEKGLIDSFSRQFKYAEYDINNDGRKEIFVGLTGPFFCGSGGCSPLLLDSKGNVISQFSVSDYPIIISSNVTNGWHDLIIESNGKKHLMKFNGKSYPSNPSTQAIYNLTQVNNLPRVLIWEKTVSFKF